MGCWGSLGLATDWWQCQLQQRGKLSPCVEWDLHEVGFVWYRRVRRGRGLWGLCLKHLSNTSGLFGTFSGTVGSC